MKFLKGFGGFGKVFVELVGVLGKVGWFVVGWVRWGGLW